MSDQFEERRALLMKAYKDIIIDDKDIIEYASDEEKKSFTNIIGVVTDIGFLAYPILRQKRYIWRLHASVRDAEKLYIMKTNRTNKNTIEYVTSFYNKIDQFRNLEKIVQHFAATIGIEITIQTNINRLSMSYNAIVFKFDYLEKGTRNKHVATTCKSIGEIFDEITDSGFTNSSPKHKFNRADALLKLVDKIKHSFAELLDRMKHETESEFTQDLYTLDHFTLFQIEVIIYIMHITPNMTTEYIIALNSRIN